MSTGLDGILLLFLNLSVIFHMKYFIILFPCTILSSCHVEKSIELTDGTFITELQYDRILKRAYKETIREMSKEDREIMKGINFKVETSGE